MKPRRPILPAVVVFSLASVNGSLHAQTIYDWKSDSPDANWTQGAGGARWYDNDTANNLWDAPGFGILRFNNDWQLNMTNNVVGTYNTNGIIFGVYNTSTRTLGGNTVRLYDYNGADPFIRNESSATHVFNLNLEGDGDAADPLQIQLNGSGGLTFNGSISNQGSWIDVVGTTTSAATVTINGMVSGAGGISKGNANTTLVLSNGSNSYTGGTSINAGVLSFANGALGTTGAVTMNGGTLQWASGNTQDISASNRLSLVASQTATFDTNGNAVTLATALGGGAIAANVAKTGLGTLTLSAANAYTGTTTVSQGTLKLGNASALGTSSLVTVASGATLDIAGLAAGRPVSISGTGVSGAAALYNSSTTAGASVGSLKLDENATIASAVPGADTSKIVGTGLIDLNGKTLTISGGAFGAGIRDITSGNININNGATLYLQSGGSQTSTTGTITINAGGKLETRDTNNTAMTSLHTIALNGGTLGRATITNNNGGGAGTYLKNNITVDGTNGGTITNNTGSFSILYNLSGALSGSGTLTLNGSMGVTFLGNNSGFTGTYLSQAGTNYFQTGANALAGTLTVTGGTASIENTATNTFSAVNLNGGTLRIKSNNNALGGATMAVGASATLASQSGSTALALPNNITIAGTNTLNVDAGYANVTLNGNITGTGTTIQTSSTGTLTLGGTANMGTSSGTVRVNSSGTLTFGSGSAVTAGTVANASSGTLNLDGTMNAATLSQTSTGGINVIGGNISATTVSLANTAASLAISGGAFTTKYFNFGDGSNTSGRITQSGGTVTIASGGTGIRIGHWNNNANPGSSYNITGGTLDATALSANSGSSRLINVGWDGLGTMSVGGGATAALVKAYGIQLDANGDSTGYADTLTISNNGTVEIGAGGIAGASNSDKVILNGGIMKATATATWASLVDANTSTSSTMDVGIGFTVTQSGILQGSGNISKTGAGTLALSNTSNTFSGKYNVTGGALSVGADSNLGAVPGAAVADSISLNASTLRLTGSMTLNANRGITVSGGSTLDTATVGTSNTAAIASVIAGSGGLVLAANGDTSASGGSVGGSFKLSGSNTFSGDVRITSGLVEADSNFGNAANTIILDGGGLVDKNLNVNFTRNIQVGAGGGVFRTYGSVSNGIIAGNVSNVAGVTSATLRHTDSGTLKLAGSGVGFTGTFNNQRGALQITANNANWANTDFLQDTNGSTITFNGGGTASIRSLSSTRDVFVQNGMTLRVGSGGITMSTNGHWWQTNSGTVGNLTSSTGTLTVTNGASTGNLTTTDHQIRLKITNDGATPVALVKNNNNSLALNQSNTFTGGTTINGGRINADQLSAFGTGSVTVNSGGQAYLTQSGTYANAFTIAGNGVTEAAGSFGAIRFSNNTIGGNVTVAAAGARVVGYTGASGTIAGSLLGTGNLEINIAGDSSANGTISLTGSGASHAGTVTVSGGRFNMGTALGGSVIVANGATLGDEGTIAGNLTLGSTTGSTLALSPSTTGRITAGGNLILNGVTALSFSGSYGAAGLINIASYSGSLTDGNGGSLTDSFSISNPADFRTFAVTDDSGTLKLDLGRQTVVWTGSTGNTWETQGSSTNWNSTDGLFFSTDVVSFNDTASNKSVAVSGTVSPDSTTFDNSAGNDYSVSGGGIGGSGSLTKTNTGTVTFTTNNTFTGAVSIQGGTVRIGDGGTTGTLGGTGAISISSGASLVYDRSDAVNPGRVATGGGTVVQDGSGSLRLGQAGNNVDITVNNGTFQALDGGWSSSYFSTANRLITINDGGTFVTATHTLGGLGGTYNRPDMVINQGGLWQLNGEQYFSGGDLTLNGGTINVGINDLRLEGGTVAVGASTSGSVISGNAVTLYGNTTFQVADGAATNDLGISAPISQSSTLGITKTGAGTLTLSGANTYTGNTAVNVGRLNVNGSIASAATVASGAFLGGDGTIAGTVNLSGTLLPGQGGTTDRSLTINGNVTTVAGSGISFRIDAMNDHDKLVVGVGSTIDLGNADLGVTFDNALTFTNLVSGEGADFLAAISSNDFSSINATWFRMIEGSTIGMFANVTTLNSSELAYLGLSGTQYAYNADNGQRFWVAQGSTYLVSIPEPRAALIGGLGLLLLLRRRR